MSTIRARFLEAARQRGRHCEVLLPFNLVEFVMRSVVPSGEGWRERFYGTLNWLQPHPDSMRIMPDELGPLPPGVDPFERCNLWLLNTALAASSRVHLVTLWNGGGDGPGTTAHLVHEVQARGGGINWIDVREL